MLSPSPYRPEPDTFEPLQPANNTDPNSQHDDDSDGIHVEPPSSAANAPAYKRPLDPKKLKRRGKGKLEGVEGGQCYILDLPEDLLHHFLTRLPPRSLLQLASTCKLLHNQAKSESIWRQCYINHFFWDGAASDGAAREQVKVLVQGCMGPGGRGWKREALSREGMLERWTASRTTFVVHHPLTVVVHNMSLSYPPHQASHKAGPLVVGKMHQTTPSKSPGASGADSPHTPSPAAKMSHRQKYEAMLAVSSRPPPSLFCAGMEVGALVRSDPLTGKVSKGFWGPGQDANFHLRPHWDPNSAPSAIFIPKRSQTHMLWGLLTGSCVHTTIQSRTHATHGGRANSVNVTSKPNDMHDGAVLSISQPEVNGTDPLKWVTGGEDGRVKYWQLNPATGRSGKKTPDAAPASITCLFTSEPVEEPLANRAEEVRLRQVAQPDAIAHVACDLQHDVVCGVTVDGDLRVWFDAASSPEEVRVDVGSEADLGGVRLLRLSCSQTNNGLVASVLVHHWKHPKITRYDISPDATVKTTFYATASESPLTTVQAFLQPTPPIARPPEPEVSLSARIVTPNSNSGANTPAAPPPELNLETLPRRLVPQEFGRFIVAGDEHGRAYIWEWDGRAVDNVVRPLRDWFATDGKVTAVDAHCSLIAVGSYDGHIDVFDPLPAVPIRVRGFRPPSHLTPGDLMVAASDELRARHYNVNHVIIENDLVVGAIGRNVLAWRAGTGKGRQSGKDTTPRKAPGGGGKGEFRGHSRTLDLRDLHQETVDSHHEIQEENTATRVHSTHERAHLAAMEDLGLADGDAALQYALMISQQEADGVQQTVPEPTTADEDEVMSDDEADAIRAVEQFKQAEEDDLAAILEQIRLAEEREAAGR
ncbi:uncharacterized protein LOC62_02G001926 [Vanrija pseudolonga]|uniref:F-box domain-containing protein n=1 Tax=Vanrija pseudolonga TaxID=143232 RepID=A0AAF0Y1E4_9TREE|nr:hypothetical protein LOC62_02G001926 [Vanrija pseudolonga]